MSLGAQTGILVYLYQKPSRYWFIIFFIYLKSVKIPQIYKQKIFCLCLCVYNTLWVSHSQIFHSFQVHNEHCLICESKSFKITVTVISIINVKIMLDE